MLPSCPSDKPLGDTSDLNTHTPYKMIQTIGLSVGAAVAYIIIVLGLMFYCKKRRKAKKRGKHGGEEPEMECLNGGAVLQNGQSTAEIQEEVPLTTLGNKRLSSGDKINFPRANLHPITTLGRGEFGEVFLAKAQSVEAGVSEAVVLVKSLQTRDEQMQMDFRRELDMFSKLNHANVVRLLGQCRETEPHYMILEYVDLGDLKQFLRISKSKDEKMKTLSTKQKVSLCSQVALGMEYLSNSRFVHKDLAARNCLVSAQRQVKVSALSLSKDVYNRWACVLYRGCALYGGAGCTPHTTMNRPSDLLYPTHHHEPGLVTSCTTTHHHEPSDRTPHTTMSPA
ncbi:hypothetical protein FKM82_030529 [Ascaphus truei]